MPERCLSFPDWSRLVDRRCWQPLCCGQMEREGIALTLCDYALAHDPEAPARALCHALNDLIRADRRRWDFVPESDVMDSRMLHLLHFLVTTTARADAVCLALIRSRLSLSEAAAAAGSVSMGEYERQRGRCRQVLDWVLANGGEELAP